MPDLTSLVEHWPGGLNPDLDWLRDEVKVHLTRFVENYSRVLLKLYLTQRQRCFGGQTERRTPQEISQTPSSRFWTLWCGMVSVVKS